MASEWRALRSGESARDRRQRLAHAHDAFVAGAVAADDPAAIERFAAQAELRPVVVESWLRSQRRTIDPFRAPQQPALSDDELAELRRIHPIARVLPVVQRLLFEEAGDSGLIVAVGDAAGRLLWLDGDSALRSRAEEMGFREGMDWSEDAVGTSAPGSALALDHAIQVLGAEHYNRAVHQWSCTAAPVHDPASGAIIGVIDVTGGDTAASPHLLPLLEATLAAVEAELKLESLRALVESRRPERRTAAVRRAAPRLVLLGRDPALLEHDRGSAVVSGRHAEILAALAVAPGGLAAAALAEQVYGAAGFEQTLRPELVRLRRWLSLQGAGIDLLSRPYRLNGPLRVDAVETLEALGRGAHRLALAAYEGPVLPGSDAPVIERLRAEVDGTLRESLLQASAAEPLFDYAQNWAPDDAQVWETLLQVLPPLSPKRARVVARLEQIARER